MSSSMLPLQNATICAPSKLRDDCLSKRLNDSAVFNNDIFPWHDIDSFFETFALWLSSVFFDRDSESILSRGGIGVVVLFVMLDAIGM